MDLHSGQCVGYFDIPVDHVYGETVILDYLASKRIATGDLVSVSAVHGGAFACLYRIGAAVVLMCCRSSQPLPGNRNLETHSDSCLRSESTLEASLAACWCVSV